MKAPPCGGDPEPGTSGEELSFFLRRPKEMFPPCVFSATACAQVPDSGLASLGEEERGRIWRGTFQKKARALLFSVGALRDVLVPQRK